MEQSSISQKYHNGSFLSIFVLIIQPQKLIFSSEIYVLIELVASWWLNLAEKEIFMVRAFELPIALAH
jgi:hypothetical protein